MYVVYTYKCILYIRILKKEINWVCTPRVFSFCVIHVLKKPPRIILFHITFYCTRQTFDHRTHTPTRAGVPSGGFFHRRKSSLTLRRVPLKAVSCYYTYTLNKKLSYTPNIGFAFSVH